MNNNNIDKVKIVLEESKVSEKISPNSIKKMLDEQLHLRDSKIKVYRNWVKILSAVATITLVVGLGTNFYNQNKSIEQLIDIVDVAEHDCIDEEVLNVSNLKQAESYEEVYEYLYEMSENSFVVYEEGMADGGIINYEMSEEMEVDVEASLTKTNEYYTETYNQEVGVNEADIVKTDGKKIFYCSSDILRVVDVKDGKFSNDKIITDNLGTVEQMYLYQDKVILISTDWNNYEDKTTISVYSKETYEIIGEFTQDGRFHDVRLMDDGYMYIISNQYGYIDDINEEDIKEYIPLYKIGEQDGCIDYNDIYISTCNYGYDASYINISSFYLNSEKPCNPIDIKSIVGNSGVIYCSADNLYITYGYDTTEITRFSLSSGKITPRAGTKVNGYVNDQFSMSEYNGYFRIATSFNTNNALYVLDMELEEVGFVTDFGLGEEIYSAKFDGNMVYIVTFERTDPLYSIDVSDPTNPIILDELKITGYSDYMQTWDNGMLLGFGESGDENGLTDGIKLSMFDNSDPDNLDLIDSTEINSSNNYYITSTALTERKALLISPEKNIIGIPVFKNLYMDMDDGYYEDGYGNMGMISAYFFYSFENNEFVLEGKLEVKKSEHRYFGDERAVIIGDYVYALFEDTFTSASLIDFEEIDRCYFEY